MKDYSIYESMVDAFCMEWDSVDQILYEGLSNCKKDQFHQIFLSLRELNVDELLERDIEDNLDCDLVFDILEEVLHADNEVHFIVLHEICKICNIDINGENGCAGSILNDIVAFIEENMFDDLSDGPKNVEENYADENDDYGYKLIPWYGYGGFIKDVHKSPNISDFFSDGLKDVIGTELQILLLSTGISDEETIDLFMKIAYKIKKGEISVDSEEPFAVSHVFNDIFVKLYNTKDYKGNPIIRVILADYKGRFPEDEGCEDLLKYQYDELNYDHIIGDVEIIDIFDTDLGQLYITPQNDVNSLFEKRKIKRGKEIVEQGKIKILKKYDSMNVYSAEGSKIGSKYRIEIEECGKIRVQCTCPDGKEYNYCKHIMAALILESNSAESVLKDEYKDFMSGFIKVCSEV